MACLVAHYEERLRQLSCDPKGRMAGAAIGAAACAGYTLRILERELQPLEARRWLEGIVNRPDRAIDNAPRGQRCSYRVRAKFEASSGTAQRLTGRVGEFRFAG